jgi:hypothetical protein
VAVARKGQHKVTIHPNVAAPGAVEMITPEGQLMRSHILGLAYYDAYSGKSVLIAETKSSLGQLIPPNQVLFEDAFDGVSADVIYTYSKWGFAQDVNILAGLPAPEDFGMVPTTTRIEIWTEFVEAPVPEKREMTLHKEGSEPRRSQMAEPDLVDELLDFGSLQFTRGKAFVRGEEAENFGVAKRWTEQDGRTVLVEGVQLEPITPALARINALSNPGQQRSANTAQGRVFPQKPSKENNPADRIHLASKAYEKLGFLVDYQAVQSQSNWVFLSGQTYLVQGLVTLRARSKTSSDI